MKSILEIGMGVLAVYGFGHATKERVVVQDEKLIINSVNVEKLDLSALDNRPVGGLNSLYLGVKGRVPDEKKINWAKNLDRMWQLKVERNPFPASKAYAKKSVQVYLNNPKKTTLDDFIADADYEIKMGYKSIDWPALCKKLKVKNCRTLKRASSRIKAENLVAYGMTEIFPAHNGKFNRSMLETILENGGETFIHEIPALGDDYLSKGFYQFTSYAIRHDTKVEGASIVSQYSSRKIPGSVVFLANNEQHLAAYYFVIHNLARLVRKTDVDFTRIDNCTNLEINQFIATAHHLPAKAVSGAKKWIEAGCRKDYKEYLKPKLREYAQKTKNNFEAL